jgi:hypothetical protein
MSGLAVARLRIGVQASPTKLGPGETLDAVKKV